MYGAGNKQRLGVIVWWCLATDITLHSLWPSNFDWCDISKAQWPARVVSSSIFSINVPQEANNCSTPEEMMERAERKRGKTHPKPNRVFVRFFLLVNHVDDDFDVLNRCCFNLLRKKRDTRSHKVNPWHQKNDTDWFAFQTHDSWFFIRPNSKDVLRLRRRSKWGSFSKPELFLSTAFYRWRYTKNGAEGSGSQNK